MIAYYLGIDQGTTYSAAAVMRDGKLEMASLGGRVPEIPSVVFLRENGVLVGESAVRRGLSDPQRVVKEFKRRFGDPTPIMVGGTPLAADSIWATVLGWILETVAKNEGGAPAAVAVTHPANWGPYKLDLLNQAIRMADVLNFVTLSEPEAAAIFYAHSNRVEPGQSVAVYDLGGGTFDAAILRRTASAFELVGKPEGIERLGGIDIDEAVFTHVASFLGGAFDSLDPEDPAARSAVARLRSECVAAKEVLSSDSEVTIPVTLPALSTEVRLNRAELEAAIRPTLKPTVDALRRAVTDAGLSPADLSAVLLVGGSSRIPLVGQLVGEALGRPVVINAHPKHSIAQGAALHARATTPQQAGPASPRRLAISSPTAPSNDLVPAAEPELHEAPPSALLRSRRRAILDWPTWAQQTVAVVMLGVALLAFLALRNRGLAGGGGPILLEGLRAAGAGSFTESVALVFPETQSSGVVTVDPTPQPPVTAPAFESDGSAGASGGIRSLRGGTPGLFGGLTDRAVCDSERLSLLLQADPERARAFADAQGIAPADLDRFIADLTPVLLRGDTRVTDHRFLEGQAEARQAVLQAGTAVLVDELGVPRIRCASGSPLKPAIASRRAPEYEGARWGGFDPSRLAVIVQNTSPIATFTLIDVESNQAFELPVEKSAPEAARAPAEHFYVAQVSL